MTNKLETSLVIKANVDGVSKVNELAKSVDKVNQELVGTKSPSANAKTAIDGLGREMNETAINATTLKNTLNGLKGMLAGLGVTVGAKELLDMAEGFKSLEAKVKLATGEGVNFVNAMDGLKAVANETNAGLDETATLFTKIDGAGKALGLTQKESLEVTKSINQAIKLSGGSAESSAAAIQQLVQGLQSGVLRGDEFNSVMEQAPELAKVMADGLGVTTHQLRAMASEGKLTDKTIITAMQSQAGAIEARYKQLPVTVGDAITGLKNELMLFVGSLDKELGGSNALAKFIMGIKDNLANLDPATVEAIKLAFENLGEIAQTVWQSVGDVVDVFTAFNNMGNDESVSLITSLMQKLALATGAVSDVIKAIAMVANGAFGAIVREIGMVYEAFAMMTGKSTDTAQEMQKTGQAMIDNAKNMAMNFESSFGKAWDNMGKTAKERLDETANTARQKYEKMAQDGQASAGKLEEAFIDYAQKAIKANDGVVDSTLKQELAQRNLQAVTDETGKVIISSMDKAKKAVDGVDLSKHTDSFKTLGIDMGEFAGGLSSKANTALTAFNDLAGVAGTNATQLAMAYNGAKQAIGDNATALAELDKALLQATYNSTDLANGIKALAQEQQNAKSATEAHAKALSELGINMQAINAGMSDGGQKIAQSLNMGLTAIKNTATSATALKIALSQAFDTAAAKAQTTADFGAIKQAIEQAGLASHLTAEQIKTLNTGMTGGSEAVKKSLADEAHARQAVTTATTAQTTATHQNTTATHANAKAKTELANATDNATQATQAQATTEQKVSSGTPFFVADTHNKILALDKLGASTEALNRVNGSLYQRLNGRVLGSFRVVSEAMGQVSVDLDKQIDGFKRTSQQVDDYTKRLSGASVSAEDLSLAQNVLANATNASINGINVMDKARLDNLKAQIDSAKAKMHELADTAKNVADNLEGELARMQGNDKKALELENAQKLADLEKKLTEARQRGNADEIRQLERALNLQRQINQEKVRKMHESETQKAEQAKREQEQRQIPSRQSTQNSDYDPSGLAREVADNWERRLQEAEERGAKRGAEELVKRLASEGKRRAY